MTDYKPKNSDTISCVGLSELVGWPVRKPHGEINVCAGKWVPMYSLGRRCVGYRFHQDPEWDK